MSLGIQNSMPQHVVCFDFDGTLVNGEGVIHPRDIEILAGERRVTFIPATARPLHSVRLAFERNGLFVGQPIPFPLVLQNGAVLYGSDETLQAQFPIPPTALSALMKIALRHHQVTFWFYGLTEAYALWPTPATEKLAQRFDLCAKPLHNLLDQTHEFTKLVCIAETPEPVDVVAAETAQLNLEQSYSLPGIMEVNRPGINKGYGLVTLLNSLGLAGAEILAAGDGGERSAVAGRGCRLLCPQLQPPRQFELAPIT